MPRTKLVSTLDVIFGSHAQAEIIRVLVTTFNRWLNIKAISYLAGTEYKTTRLILERLFKHNIAEKKHGRRWNYPSVNYRLVHDDVLVNVLESLLLRFDKNYLIERQGKRYKLLRRDSDWKRLLIGINRVFYYEIIIEPENELLDIQFDDGTYGMYVYLTDLKLPSIDKNEKYANIWWTLLGWFIFRDMTKQEKKSS